MYSEIKECFGYTIERRAAILQHSSHSHILTNITWDEILTGEVKTVKHFGVYLSLRLETDRERIFFLHGFLRWEAETVSLGIPSDGGTVRGDMSMCMREERERELERGKEHVCAHRKERGRVWVRAQMMLLVEGDGAGFGVPSCATRFSPLRFDLCILSVWHLGFPGKSCSLFATGIRAGCCKHS